MLRSALTSSVSSGGVGVGVGKVTYYAGGTAVATAAVDAAGVVAPASWTPKAAGSVDLYAKYDSTDGTQSATSPTSSVTIDRAPTVTTLTLPATAQVGKAITATAKVTAGSYVPTGSVAFLLPDGTVLTAATLNASGVATISVQMPSAATTYQLRARYNRDANTQTSISELASTLVTANGSNVALTLSSAVVSLGVPVTLTAAITPTTATGTVTFAAGSVILGAQPVNAGKAVQTWTPSTAGAVTVTATYTPTGAVAPTGTDSENVTVQSALTVDKITLAPTGQAAWTPGAGYPVRNGTTLTFTATSLSGGAVTLTATGPCTVAALSVTANAGSGACVLTARSAGSSKYQAATQTNTLTLIRGRQTAVLAPPPPGSLTRFTVYRLAGPGTRTNAGATVKWRVPLGAKRCKVLRQADGTVLLRAKRLGRCNVRAYAPAVPGQWIKFKKTYRYRVVR